MLLGSMRNLKDFRSILVRLNIIYIDFNWFGLEGYEVYVFGNMVFIMNRFY